MPVRGRHQETLALLPRLASCAGVPYRLTVMVDADPELYGLLRAHLGERVTMNERRQGYWGCLRQGAQRTAGDMIVTLANDLLPGSQWLQRALEAHARTFSGGEGLIGFNDGIHFGEHAAHFLVSRSLLRRWYGEDYFPVCYDHTYGDSEMCLRAEQEGKFAVANFALLFHNHPYNGRPSDEIYAEGQAKTEFDKRRYYHRWQNHWKD